MLSDSGRIHYRYGRDNTTDLQDTNLVADNLFNDAGNNNDFNLPFNSRHTLSSILIVHPIAAFMNLVCLGLAAAAHFHSPSHSARYLLGLLILLFPTLLVTLLAFLVDILLFVPHLAWGGWIVLASTILITASGVVTCAMRRTLVSRKARKKRIAENAEMSGENFYNRQSLEAKMISPIIPIPPLTLQPKPPLVNGAPGADNLPSFATYEASRRRSDDERRPLNQRTPSSGRGNGMPRTDASDPYGMPPIRSKSQQPATGARDGYGNPLPPSNAFGPIPGTMGRQPSEGRRNQSVPPGTAQYSRDNAFSPARGGGYGPPRGRGGYPPRGGTYGPRGGYGGLQGQQGFGGRGGHGQRGGYPSRGRGGFAMDGVAAAGTGMVVGGMMNRDPRAPPPGYPPLDQFGRPMPEGVQSSIDGAVVGRQDSYRPVSPSDYGQSPTGTIAPPGAYGARRQSPARGQSPYEARNQSPVGGIIQNEPVPPMPNMPANGALRQTHELDAPLAPPGAYVGSQSNSLRDSDTDVRGMVGLQQNRQGLPASPYPAEEYVPPRAAWTGAHHAASIDPDQPSRRIQSPVELPSSHSNVGGTDGAYSPSRNRHNNRPRVSSGGSDLYYEDVSPRFANDPEPRVQQRAVPALLTPGPRQPPAPLRQVPGANGEMIPLTSSYENLQEGARSPAESETSNFTSVSQRGVNPNWRPQDGPGAFNTGLGPPRRIQQQTQMRRDMMLTNNPDFEIPGLAGSARGGRGGTRGGGTVRRPIGAPPAASSIGTGGEGRYPVGP